MKKTLLCLSLSLGISSSVFAQDANLSLSNLSSQYNKYDNSTKSITGIVFVVGADGTDSKNYISTEFE